MKKIAIISIIITFLTANYAYATFPIEEVSKKMEILRNEKLAQEKFEQLFAQFFIEYINLINENSLGETLFGQSFTENMDVIALEQFPIINFIIEVIVRYATAFFYLIYYSLEIGFKIIYAFVYGFLYAIYYAPEIIYYLIYYSVQAIIIGVEAFFVIGAALLLGGLLVVIGGPILAFYLFIYLLPYLLPFLFFPFSSSNNYAISPMTTYGPYAEAID